MALYNFAFKSILGSYPTNSRQIEPQIIQWQQVQTVQMHLNVHYHLLLHRIIAELALYFSLNWCNWITQIGACETTKSRDWAHSTHEKYVIQLKT